MHMSDLRDLYQEVILDHYKHPKNFGSLPAPARQAQGTNPLCGDQVTVYALLSGDRIERVMFEGHGCAISTASASLMTEAVAQASVSEAVALSQAFRNLVTSGAPTTDGPDLGKLEVLAGVHEFPIRIKCATLAWHALSAALEADPEARGEKEVARVSTE